MKIIVIGCTHAGTIAATEILKNHPDADVTIYERHNNFSFLSCGIALYLDGQVKRLEDMFYSSPDELRELGATVHDNHDVLKVNAKEHTVQVADMKSGEVFTDTYDKLIMTTGSSVVVPHYSGSIIHGFCCARTISKPKQFITPLKNTTISPSLGPVTPARNLQKACLKRAMTCKCSNHVGKF